MKKIFLLFLIFLFLVTPVIGFAADNICGGPIVTCDGTKDKPCDFDAFITMIATIYEFIVKCFATPLAIIAIIIGGVLMMISAGDPNKFTTGRKILVSAIIGLILAYASFLIVKYVLETLGVKPEIYQDYIQ